MSNNEFDKLLLKKLREEEMEYKPESWERLSQLLPPEMPSIKADGNRKWLVLTSAAAVVAMSLAVFFFYKFVQNKPANDGKAALLAGQIIAPVKPAPTEEMVLHNTTEYTPQPARGGKTPSAAAHVTAYSLPTLATTRGSTANNLAASMNIAAMRQKEQSVNSNAMIKENTGNDIVATPAQPPVTDKPEQNQQLFAHEASNLPRVTYDNYLSQNKNAGQTSIGLGGGMSYGNMNAGYAIGVSARTKIAGDFFVDGTVAMLYNNNTSNTAVNNGPPLNDNSYKTAARPESFSQTVATPAISPIQKLYYVQFNPSVGYQIDPNIAVSVGGDFQQMLNKNEEIVLQSANQAKILPNFDIGLTTKSEFSITPNIQAGLIYREGLNNLIKNESIKYVNRRYIQVQFKYNLPLN